MSGQVTIFDLLYPEKIKPIREVAIQAAPGWRSSREKLIDLFKSGTTIKEFAHAVREEYCPYGAYGSYRGDRVPNTLQGWDMRTDVIKCSYYDEESKLHDQIFSWEDFAREIGDMIMSGEYKEVK